MARNSRRQTVNIPGHSIAHDIARKLVIRVEKRLRRSAKNRNRQDYARGYREAADLIHQVIPSSDKK